MNHRQWKKNYKKKYGFNPSIVQDRKRKKKERFNLVMKLSRKKDCTFEMFLDESIKLVNKYHIIWE